MSESVKQGKVNPTLIVGNTERKLTRAEKREANRLRKAQVEVAEIAAFSGVPPTLAMLRAGELAQNSAALVTPAGVDGIGCREGDRETGKRALGRPSEYSDTQADQLCAWVAGGGSLRAWCREHGRSMETVYRWMRENAHFQARYARAHEDRADTLTDEMLEIADAAAGQDASIEGVAAAKLRVETRKWIASKLRPQKWGEKQVIEHAGNVSIRIGIPQKPVAPAIDVTPRAPKLR